jgi:uncharacterized membrane protein YhaH (DUF805 family)
VFGINTAIDIVLVIILFTIIHTAGADAPIHIIPLFALPWVAVNITPGISIIIRRLHDTGRSGIFTLLAVIPCIGGLILLYLLTGAGVDSPESKYTKFHKTE